MSTTVVEGRTVEGFIFHTRQEKRKHVAGPLKKTESKNKCKHFIDGKFLRLRILVQIFTARHGTEVLFPDTSQIGFRVGPERRWQAGYFLLPSVMKVINGIIRTGKSPDTLEKEPSGHSLQYLSSTWDK